MDGNIAGNGGSVYADSNNYAIELYEAEIVNGVADYGAGAYFGMNHDNIKFTYTTVRNNKGTFDGGGVMCDTGVTIAFTSCTLDSNSAGRYGGGIYQLSSGQLQLYSSTLVDHTAVSGGAIYFSGDSLQISFSTMSSNTALLGDEGFGGALFVQKTSLCYFWYNSFVSNQAALGGAIYTASTSNFYFFSNNFLQNLAALSGGGVYWLQSTMIEPNYLNEFSNYFSANIILDGGYGVNIATEASALHIESESKLNVELLTNVNDNHIEVISYADFLDLSVQIVDFYGQVVTTDSTSFVVVSVLDTSTCDDQNAYLTGGITVQSQQGIVAFNQFQAHCKPMLNMIIEFGYIGSDSSTTVSDTTANLHFRECKRGEYYSNGECIECGDGTYSLLDNFDLSVTTCNYCPINALKCYGGVIEVKAGYWRISDDSSYLSVCPYGFKACLQGNETGENTCTEGYSGIFCGSCATGYYLETFTSTCKKCEASKVNVLGVVMIAIAAVMAIGFLFNKFWLSIVKISGLAFVLKRFENQIQLAYENTAWKLRRNKFKQVISLFQILTSLPSVLSMIFPNIFTAIVSSFKIINFNFFNDLGLSCRLETFDYVDYLLVNTLSPIALCFLLLAMQQLHVLYWKYRFSAQFHEVLNIKARILATRNAYFTLIILLMYVVLPGKHIVFLPL
jgi:predicted outer membrane repeat protein